MLAQDLQVQQKTKILMVTSVAEIDAHKVLEKLMRELDISQLENTEAQSSEAQSSNIYLVPIVDWETIVMWDEIMWNEMDEIHSPILSFMRHGHGDQARIVFLVFFLGQGVSQCFLWFWEGVSQICQEMPPFWLNCTGAVDWGVQSSKLRQAPIGALDWCFGFLSCSVAPFFVFLLFFGWPYQKIGPSPKKGSS